MMDNSEKITGAQYAERLLGVPSPQPLLDNLLNGLRSTTGNTWESKLLEIKASYHPSPNHPDPDDFQPDYFEWNIVHAFLALANAQGGCVIIGIAETESHQLEAGDWDPDQVITCKNPKTGKREKTGLEDKDLTDRIRQVFFSDKAKRNGREYKFSRQPDNPKAPPVDYRYVLSGETVSALEDLVSFYPCHSETLVANAIAAIVKPVAMDGDLLETERVRKGKTDQVVFYRANTAKTEELISYKNVKHYERNREPSCAEFALALQKWEAGHRAVDSETTISEKIHAYQAKLQKRFEEDLSLYVDLDAEERDSVADGRDILFNDADEVDYCGHSDDRNDDEDFDVGTESENSFETSEPPLDHAHSSGDEEESDGVNIDNDPAPHYLIRRNLLKLLNEEPRLALIGEPGAGKSTSMTCFALRKMRECNAPPKLFLRIRLALWAHACSVENLAEATSGMSWDEISSLIVQKRLCLLLDAVNECPDMLRFAAIQAIATFASRHPDVPIVISGRTPDDVRWFNFPTYSVRTMERHQQQSFLSKHLKDDDRATGLLERIYLQPGGANIAANPLLLGMVCDIVKDASAELPPGRATLYRKWLHRWFKREQDKAKEANCGLLAKNVTCRLPFNNEKDVRTRLAHIALIGRLKGCHCDISLDIITKEVANFNPTDVIYQGPLLTISDGVLRFRHETFQEYLCAEALLEHADILNGLKSISYKTWGMPLAYAYELAHNKCFPSSLASCASTCSPWFGWILQKSECHSPVANITGATLLANMERDWYGKDDSPLRYVLATSCECNRRWIDLEASVLDRFSSMRTKNQRRAFVILFFRNVLLLKLQDLTDRGIATNQLFDYIKNRPELTNILLNSGFANLDELPGAIKDSLAIFKNANLSADQVIGYRQSGIITEEEFQAHVARLTNKPTIATATTLVKTGIFPREHFAANIKSWRETALKNVSDAVQLVKSNFCSVQDLLDDYSARDTKPTFTWLTEMYSHGCLSPDSFLSLLTLPENISSLSPGAEDYKALVLLQSVPDESIANWIDRLVQSLSPFQLCKALSAGLLAPHSLYRWFSTATYDANNNKVQKLAHATGLFGRQGISGKESTNTPLPRANLNNLINELNKQLHETLNGENRNGCLVCQSNERFAKLCSLDHAGCNASLRTRTHNSKHLIPGDVWMGEISTSPKKHRDTFRPVTLLSASPWDGRSIFITHAHIHKVHSPSKVTFSLDNTSTKFLWRHRTPLWCHTASEWTLEVRLK